MKKKKFNNLKPGQKFKYERKLYLLDELFCVVHISTGQIMGDSTIPQDTLVTPVKISIQVK